MKLTLSPRPAKNTSRYKQSLGFLRDLLPTTTVNDVHSQLNRTQVVRVFEPESLPEVQTIIRETNATGQSLSIAGARHAMGKQQFVTNGWVLDTRKLKRVLNFDAERGLIEVEAGMQWPELIQYLWNTQKDSAEPWGIAQKQTGADHLTIGGAVAANVHGRGLSMKPFIADIESLTVVDADGVIQKCDRVNNPKLFRLVVGGYGLFGFVYSVTLRLTRRQVLQRVVKLLDVAEAVSYLEARRDEGFLYGDFQFAIDSESDEFLKRGVCSCYQPVAAEHNYVPAAKSLRVQDWEHLLYLAHVEPSRAFAEYSTYYLSTHGQLYWSDTHQQAEYVDNYHTRLNERIGCACGASEMITEIYVPRERLADFMAEAGEELRARKAKVIYGTVRLIERDEESFLAWAKQNYVCIIFNLHIEHTAQDTARNAEIFRMLIDLAIKRGGNFYLTYHRFATRQQIEACYPQFAEFLQLKEHYDPQGVFQSDWYRHHKRLFTKNT